MEEKAQRIKKENIGSNIGKLIRIHLIQQRNLIVTAGVGIIIYFLFITVCEIVAYNNVRYYEIINGYSGVIWCGILCILIPVYQLFTNEAISMYPGNAVTRFLGRMIADHIRLFIYVLCVGLAYMMQCGLLWVCLQGKTGIDIQVVFDVRYLGAGLLRVCVICMALYGVLACFLALDARFGNFVSMALLLILLAAACSFMRYHPSFVVSVWEWGQKWTVDNTDLFSYLCVFVLIWLVCILAAGMLAYHIRFWRISRWKEYVVVTVVAFLTIGTVFLTAWMEGLVESGEDDSVIQYEPGDLYCSTLVKLPENNIFGMDQDMVSIVNSSGEKEWGDLTLYDYINNDNNIGYCVAGISEAAALGIPKGVDLSSVDEDHAVLVYQLPNIRINGQEIYRDLMEDMSKYIRQVENQTDLKLEYCGRLQSTICMDCFPSVDRFLHHGSHDMTMAEYYCRTPFLQTTLLMSDARYEEFERAMDE